METKVTSYHVTNHRARIIGDDNDEELLSPSNLLEMLREGTKESHNRLMEDCQYLKDFFRGCIRRELFKRAAAALYFVYTAIEEEMEKNNNHPHISPVYFPAELHRQEALAQDLEYFYGEDWKSQISISPGIKPCLDRIKEVGEKDPVLLVAHACSRYMGDLAGAQFARRVAQKALKLPSTGEGLNFYQFENIHSLNSFKRLFHSRMNKLELDTETKQRIVDESNRLFVFDMMMFTELEEIGKTIEEDVQEPGLGHSHADIIQGGDIKKFPNHVPATSGNLPHVCQCVMMLLRHPRCQVALAACVAVLAGFTAWYLL
nr:PREDICTED: heme oxygenase 2-like [Paralichthys olivaceus]